LESDENIHWNQTIVLDFLKHQLGIQVAMVLNQSELFTQQLTHQQIKARFIHVELLEMPASLKKLDWLARQKIPEFPFPKIIHEWLSTTDLLTR
jgi:A/G-specific adenine glycosylase